MVKGLLRKNGECSTSQKISKNKLRVLSDRSKAFLRDVRKVLRTVR